MQMLSQNVYSRVASIRGHLIATHLHQLYYDKVTPQEALREVTQIQPLWKDIDKVFHTFFILTEPQLEYLAKENDVPQSLIKKWRASDYDFYTVNKQGQIHPTGFTGTMSVFGMLDYYVGLKEQRDARNAHKYYQEKRAQRAEQERQNAKGYGEQKFNIKRTPDETNSSNQAVNTHNHSTSNKTTPPQAPSTHVIKHVFDKARIAISDFFNK